MSYHDKDGIPGDHTLCIVYFDMIIPTVGLLLLMMMLFASYKYIKSTNIKNKPLFCTGLIFIVTVFLTIIAKILLSLYIRRDVISSIVWVVSNQLYIIQTLSLFGMLFVRLYFVFNGTEFSLSTTTIRLYWIFYTLMIILLFFTINAYKPLKGTVFGWVVVGSAAIMYLSTMIILPLLFLYKMNQVYKCTDKRNADPELIGLITKTSILAIMSIFAKLFHAICRMILLALISTIHTVMISTLLVIFDVSINFWCIILSYRDYNDWYLRVCGYCDSKCTECWYRIVEKETKDQMMTAIKVDRSNVVKEESHKINK